MLDEEGIVDLALKGGITRNLSDEDGRCAVFNSDLRRGRGSHRAFYQRFWG